MKRSVGGKVRSLSLIVLVLGIFVAIVFAVDAFMSKSMMNIVFAIVSFVSCYVISVILDAFGELVQNVFFIQQKLQRDYIQEAKENGEEIEYE